MLWAIVRPVRRPESQYPLFRKRIPQDVLPKARGKSLALKIGDEVIYSQITEKTREIKLSLRATDPSEVRERQADLAAQLERHWRAIRSGPQRLTHKQVVSLAGEIYKLVVDVFEDDPETPENWDAVIEANRRSREGLWPLHIGSTEARVRKGHEHAFGPLVDFVISKHSLEIDDESRVRLLRKAGEFLDRAAERLKRNAEGDYSTDVLRKGFPSWTSAAPKQGVVRASTQPRVSLQTLFDDWWAEAKATGLSEATKSSYGNAVQRLRAFLKHEDAARVTPDDIIAFKDARLREINPRSGKPISPKTVKDSDLAGLKSVFGWGVRNRRLDTNPVDGVTVKVTRVARMRTKSFTVAEAKAILGASLAHRRAGKESPKMAAAKRWVPWLCAYTGARVGEIVQLCKVDVRQDEGGWHIRITPEAGRVKDKDVRDVPLHSHLIEQGFVSFVEASEEGHLFYSPNAAGETGGPWRTTKNRIRDFARKVVTDPDVQPNHAWRHRFLTEGRLAKVPERVLHEITGHAPANVGEAYGEVPLSVMRDGIERFPRLQV
ncbi:tyrosine-type recombinase/integrase [Amorphus coralli]|uniref:tyrosine-type recombinase/integrase n=1 Tax=Amorphus coralli TaxID=340680 RepID=UPI00035D4209|nr:tyrosine-type recombinase/integrase [Amorphus coralli]